MNLGVTSRILQNVTVQLLLLHCDLILSLLRLPSSFCNSLYDVMFLEYTKKIVTNAIRLKKHDHDMALFSINASWFYIVGSVTFVRLGIYVT